MGCKNHYGKTMSIPYVKMHGCYNDYVYVDNLDGQTLSLDDEALSKLSIGLSNRKEGIGSDGLIVLDPADDETPEAVARMRMLNADGSFGKMCGNGIRCVAKLLYEKMGPRDSYIVETDSGPRECFIVDAENPHRFYVKVNMGMPKFKPIEVPVLMEGHEIIDKNFEVDGKTFKISCISMGNPHCVIEVKDLENFDVAKYGFAIEKHESFPDGVNVEFIEAKGGKVFQRTWERGSGETRACGTGACAVGVSLIIRKKETSPVQVQLRGGVLKIDWDGKGDVWMTGEAVTEKDGTFELSDFI